MVQESSDFTRRPEEPPLHAVDVWSPLFGMCTDKFGVEWMAGVPGPQPN